MSRTFTETPLLTHLDEGHHFSLKLECDQPTGSFKLRGMDLLVRHYLQHGVTSLISSSGGNAGYSAAYVAKALGADMHVVVPEYTTERAKSLIASMGARITIHGESWPDADNLAVQLAAESQLGYVHPFDHPKLWEGHATMMAEVAKDIQGEPDAVAVAVGGGGLLCGVLQGMHDMGWDHIPVIACETAGAASFKACLDANDWVTIDKIDTVAGSLGAKQVAEEAYLWTRKHPITSHIVDDQTAIEACKYFHALTGKVVEPACGAALSLMLAPKNLGHSHTLIITCGGISWQAEDL